MSALFSPFALKEDKAAWGLPAPYAHWQNRYRPS